jgi:hypothetical protein
MVLKQRTLRQSYKWNALRVLFKHDEPNLDNVHRMVCMRDHCPVSTCKFPGGFRKGRDCGHVLSIKSMIDKILEATNG